MEFVQYKCFTVLGKIKTKWLISLRVPPASSINTLLEPVIQFGVLDKDSYVFNLFTKGGSKAENRDTCNK